MSYRAKAIAHYRAVCDDCGHNGLDDEGQPALWNRLEVHHRDMNHSNNDIGNLRVLCHECHVNEHRILQSAINAGMALPLTDDDRKEVPIMVWSEIALPLYERLCRLVGGRDIHTYAMRDAIADAVELYVEAREAGDAHSRESVRLRFESLKADAIPQERR